MENGGGVAKGGGQGTPSCWDIWELGNWSSAGIASAPSSSYYYYANGTAAAAAAAAASSSCPPFSDPAAMVPTAPGDHHQEQGQLYGQHHHQHLTCLKLGKRQCYGEEGVAGGGSKRERLSSNPAAAAVPRCQVEGCSKALVDAKDYHKRHKVCEMHSKAPKVVVLGTEQRFCQQCSRFHVISEFDDSKRSCRRRLAGHNERRRKSASDSIRNSSLVENTTTSSRFPYIPTSPGRALSLLSSKASPWVSASDLSSRSSAALRELIAENRAAVLARQLFSDRGGWHNMVVGNPAILPYVPHQHQEPSQAQAQLADGWNQFQEAGNHVTLDLMQMPSSSFEILSARSKSKEDEECSEIWKSLEGTHVV
ncbi:squamosa promoter-binding-like protein 7 [Phoenix dactylifera]|uniref:Squamosa promoter-binding-like protein 7 n=1 Tax=Phoenix dactylifera TaxID=42345 RepID=A0A8B7MVX3_PHODC|nr:squamosa promoter-binding-like protein 7 [Phoenix dactylifera]